jgi:hypothetical protein
VLPRFTALIFIALVLACASATGATARSHHPGQRAISIAEHSHGSASGSGCRNARSAAWLDDPANWSPAAHAVRPGVTIHLCGTITSPLKVQGHGTPGKPITILFERGASLAEPVCDTCLDLSNTAYITVDGAGHGSIRSTDDGTGRGHHAGAPAILAMNCSHCTIERLTIADLYVHTSPADSSVDATQDNAIRFSGSWLVIADNRIHDVGWALYAEWSRGDGHDRIHGNDISRVDHGFASTSGFAGGNIGPIYFYRNHVHDFANWDSTADAYHHDGVHCYTVDGAGTASHYSGLYVYDNRFDGTVGHNATADIFMEGSPRGNPDDTPCADAGSRVYIFNNVFTSSDQLPDNDYLTDAAGGGGIYNNTVIGHDNTMSLGGCAAYGAQPPGGSAAFQNNVLSTCDSLTSGSPTGDYAPGSPDYNVYANGGQNSFVCSGNFYTFAQFGRWQACMHADGHSRRVATARLDDSGAPGDGSPVMGAGLNLTPLCKGPLVTLCTDIAGHHRPLRGPWDAGAY